MLKIAFVALVGEDDNGIQLDNGSYERIANIPFIKHNSIDDVSIHEFLSALKKLKLEPSELAMDLLVIACTMYAADTRIKRETYAEDSWTRMIDLFIPISNQSFWDGQKELLQKIFRVLTGDISKLNFRGRVSLNLSLSPRGHRRHYRMPYQTDTVCLFSGGMDSLIGAVDLLEQGTRPLLVGHAKSSDVAPYQDNCYNALTNHYTNLLPQRIYAFVRIPKNNLFGSEDHTERGSSLVLLPLGAISASSLHPQSQ